MLLFYYFLIITLSSLLKGQNPYTILGVSRTATQDEIKKMYNKKVKQFHPDINKSPDSEEKFVLISDAYDILKDKIKREKYDKFGIVDSENENIFNGMNYNDNNDIINKIIAKEMSIRNIRYTNGEFGQKRSDFIFSINDNNFAKLTSDGRPWILLFYQNENEINYYRYFFEDLLDKFGSFFGLGKVSSLESSKLFQSFGVKFTPSLFIHYPKRNLKLHYTLDLSYHKFVEFLTTKLKHHITFIGDDTEFIKWRKSNTDRVHILLLYDMNNIPRHYSIVSGFLYDSYQFGFVLVSNETLSAFPRLLGNVRYFDFPTFFFYRMGIPKFDTFNSVIRPLIVSISLDAGSISAILKKFNNTVFPLITKDNFNRICYNQCYIYCNSSEIPNDILESLNIMNVETGLLDIERETYFRDTFSLSQGDFIYIRLKSGEWASFNDISTLNELRKKMEFVRFGIIKMNKLEMEPIVYNTNNNDYNFFSEISLGGIFTEILLFISSKYAVFSILLCVLAFVVLYKVIV